MIDQSFYNSFYCYLNLFLTLRGGYTILRRKEEEDDDEENEKKDNDSNPRVIQRLLVLVWPDLLPRLRRVCRELVPELRVRPSLGWPITSSLSSGCGVTGDEGMALLEGTGVRLGRRGVEGVRLGTCGVEGVAVRAVGLGRRGVEGVSSILVASECKR
jgi:hypothetical protein